VNLPVLADAVRQRASGGPLDRIEAALAVGEELASGTDELIGTFVAEARVAGCSRMEIGQRIGVSKQAARQRFARRPQARPAGGGQEPQPRLVACLEAASDEAHAEGAADIGTQHQLLGLFQDPEAAAILAKLGVRADAVRDVSREMFAADGAPGELALLESAEAGEALRAAANLAQRAGHGHVGTGHLLGALVLDPGSRARRILARLDVSAAAIRKELECHIGSALQRRRRWGKAADHRCSFCGKSAAAGLRMIAGPGVWICAECISLCNEILTEAG